MARRCVFAWAELRVLGLATQGLRTTETGWDALKDAVTVYLRQPQALEMHIADVAATAFVWTSALLQATGEVFTVDVADLLIDEVAALNVAIAIHRYNAAAGVAGFA